ncbi:pre-mRNA-splicing factor cwc25 [Sporothrix brasiliensis 5110]|uniref:Pre-mRNA-splicing factor cwc25 n=1 Tax=Sporothrix brasiliensis 5110 TaxID=1398154 RepID=A0A0C2J3K8_9PEZI|nr:pre-mRNA-splicing factor cwc25 [Sporothrix brasiliensis 5110]KIH91632.1 pre-mRNA-splicing factor cwc25 [Sporothrix brasiliensis 5110]
MGSGDLNTKKSWHVVNLKNQRRVWESEQAALAERKKVNERIEELRKERQEEEITRQLEAAGGTKRVDRVDWMYQGPSTDNGGMVTEEAEAFLLGKRRIDAVLRGDEHKQLEKNAVPDRFASLDAPSAVGAAGALPTAASARDMAAKIREDPLLAIKRQEQQSYEAMVNDPIRRRQLMAAMGVAGDDSGDRKKTSHSSSSRRSHHRSSHHRSSHRDDDDERRHKRRRRDDSRDRDRDREQDRGRDRDSRRARRESPEDDRRSSRRNYDDRDRDRGASRRDDGGRDRSRDRRRDRSPRDRRDRRDRSPRSPSHSRSRSPPRHERPRGERDDNGDLSRREAGDRNGDRNGGRDKRPHRDNHEDRNGRDRRDNGRPPYRNGNSNSDADERARKLAAMQANAADLAKERETRLAEIEATEAAAREADDRARADDAKLRAGTGAGAMTSSFSTNLRKKVGNMGLAESLGRSRQGLQRDED